MPIKFHHVHLKSRDPAKAAEWYGRAFGFKIESSVVRPVGDTFITCKSIDGTMVIISGPRTGEQLPDGTSALHLGLEHFAVETEDFDGDLARLKALGAPVIEGPVQTPTGLRIAFFEGPDKVRIELMWFPKG